MSLQDAVIAASVYPRPAFKWLMEVRGDRVTYDTLGATRYRGKSLATLDAKLASALTQAAPGDFNRELRTKTQEALAKNMMVKFAFYQWEM